MKALQWITLGLALLPASAAWADLRVVASLPALGALVREIGGEHVTVDVLASSDEDPHFVDARPNFVVKLARADLLVSNGLELEGGWLPVVAQQARNAAILPGGRGAFEASEAVTLLDVPTGRLDRAMGDVHPGGNPHFLYDPRAGAAIALALGARMGELDPTNAATYSAAADALADRLNAIAAQYAASFAALPATQRLVVEYHASFAYLYDWLGLESIGQVEPRPGVPPDPGHVAELRSSMLTRGARVILQETFYPSSTSETLAEAVDGEVVLVAGGVAFDDGQTYSAFATQIAEELYVALTAH